MITFLRYNFTAQEAYDFVNTHVMLAVVNEKKVNYARQIKVKGKG
jgi:hypothetical protein